jgi:Flp pilus assembly protein TadD/peroxiredoxin
MARRKSKELDFSRRQFLRGMRWAPVVLLPAPLRAAGWARTFPVIGTVTDELPAHDEFRYAPEYPTKSPLDELLRLVPPGGDEFITEKYAFEIQANLDQWAKALRIELPALDVIRDFVDPAIVCNSLLPVSEKTVRSGNGIEVVRGHFATSAAAGSAAGSERFLKEIKNYLKPISRLETVEFEIVGIREITGSEISVSAEIRYDFAGKTVELKREERIGHWQTEWRREESGTWKAFRWVAVDETRSRAPGAIFSDVTGQAVGQTQSYKGQLRMGADYWRTVLDGACGVDVYGNNGVAAGDFDNDGWDDFYVCQPAGLPNRLYRNRGDGTFEDVTEKSGVGVLDGTVCALFADFENKGVQDLLVVCGSGPLLFQNQGNGKFIIKRDAFPFEKPAEGTFTGAAIADYDGDGLLDIYFCVYNYYQGLDQYRYPVPYFDARNGPPNFLFHNEGNGTFRDRTAAAGLNVDNDRYSFACAWGDSGGMGKPDLYVANDFGRSNLYRNNGDGKFTAVSAEAEVEDAGAGMSGCWRDLDNDGKEDIYVANMWSAAGLRVSAQKNFQEKQPDNIRALYNKHAMGNSLYRNRGSGKFENVSVKAGVEMGRWAWSSDAWDFDHDGYADLYIANGYISGADKRDVASFFWRQVVAKSPADSSRSLKYEQGWGAINELIRSDATWNGRERNVLYANNRDGTFSEVSGVSGMDFPDDSRAFALADLDHDGRLEVVLKNRNAPQLRVLHNVMKEIGNSVVFRLKGTKSNRDAIGSSITVEAGGIRQTQYLQAGSGFLSQHSKELLFGVGRAQGAVRATIRWPRGLTQSFEGIPVNHRIELEEGSASFQAKSFSSTPASYSQASAPVQLEPLPSAVETWLIEPLQAPDFSVPDLGGKIWTLRSFRGGWVLLHFWGTARSACSELARELGKNQATFTSNGLSVMAINIDKRDDEDKLHAFVKTEGITLPVLLATEELAGIYNIVYRYMFDRRRNLPIPSSLLVNERGEIVKIYQGPMNPKQFIEDLKTAPANAEERVRKALPFCGTLYDAAFQRNDFTYGVAMFQHGYLEEAAASFKQVIEAKPDNPEAFYNLGTLHLRRNELAEARTNLEQGIKLRQNYPEALNNLGMVAAKEGKTDEAIRRFQQALEQRPDYTIAMVNLGNLYRRQGGLEDSQKLLGRALKLEPDDPEVNYSLGMLYARQDELEKAAKFLETAISAKPDYADALNNLGVVLVREQRLPEAEAKFKECIRVAPNFDQAYLNLARLYVVEKEKEKARETLRELLKVQPQHKMAEQALEMLN